MSSDSENPVIDRPQSPSTAGHGSEPSVNRAEPGTTDLPSRGRAERVDKARNRALILAAASEAFAKGGTDTQMDDIAAGAGLGVGTLYRHFATKEALMVALVERKFEQILDVARRGVEREDGEPFKVFADVLRQGAEVASADAAAQDALMRPDNIIWSGVEPIRSQLRAVMQVLIDRAQRAGAMRHDLSADDISMIMCGVSSTMSSGEWDWRRYLELILDGLRAGAVAGKASS